MKYILKNHESQFVNMMKDVAFDVITGLGLITKDETFSLAFIQ